MRAEAAAGSAVPAPGAAPGMGVSEPSETRACIYSKLAKIPPPCRYPWFAGAPGAMAGQMGTLMNGRDLEAYTFEYMPEILFERLLRAVFAATSSRPRSAKRASHRQRALTFCRSTAEHGLKA